MRSSSSGGLFFNRISLFVQKSQIELNNFVLHYRMQYDKIIS